MSENALKALDPVRPDAIMPRQSEWNLMREMAAALVPTGFLPESIKRPEQAVAIMLKGRELGVPPMYALSNIAIVEGKPTISAEMMLALIYRDHGKKAIRVKESSNTHCTVEYRLEGWGDVSSYTFTMEDAAKAGLATSNTWKQYPAAMLRARCISAVARMAFPESIAGMYVPGELGDPVTVTDDGQVVSADTGEIVADVEPIRNAPVDRSTASPRDETPKAIPADTEGWQTANKRLHAVAKKYGIPHESLSEWADDKHHAESLKDVTAAALSKLADALDDGTGRAAEQFLAKYAPVPSQGQLVEAEIVTDYSELGQ